MTTATEAMQAQFRSDRCPTCHRKRKRGSDANARLWALYHAAADKLRPEGNAYSAEQYHVYFKSRFLGCKDYQLPNNRTLTIPASTADLSTEEFSKYMDQVEADLADRGVFLDELPA